MGASNVFNIKAPQLMDRDFNTRGALDINIKDMKIVKRMGEELGVPLYMNEICLSIFEKASAMGFGKEDFCAVAKVYEQEANCEIRRKKITIQ
jgi:3-hydroxyisobutyrate dehydrogenase-like beta-hydroxyacid dehydrogenase